MFQLRELNDEKENDAARVLTVTSRLDMLMLLRERLYLLLSLLLRCLL